MHTYEMYKHKKRVYLSDLINSFKYLFTVGNKANILAFSNQRMNKIHVLTPQIYKKIINNKNRSEKEWEASMWSTSLSSVLMSEDYRVPKRFTLQL